MKGRVLGALIAITSVLSTTVATEASAGPTVWTKARDPRVSLEDDVVREAQKAFVRYRRMTHASGPQVAPLAALVLRDTRLALGRLVSSGTADFSVRLLYAEVLRESRDNDEAFKVLTKLLADRPPEPIRGDALSAIAVLHAIAGRREEEIAAYTQALAFEPHGLARSRLLANRAEALMAMGDITAAVDGYRAALAPLTNVEMFWVASTTLFGLGVALDRAGNPEAGMESVKLARSYDPIDRRMRQNSGWFFSPAHDEHWYWALGGWACGRSGSVWALRAECYRTAIAEWELYIEQAPADDPWVALARVRLAAVRRESEQMKQTFEAQHQADGTKKQPEGFRSGFRR